MSIELAPKSKEGKLIYILLPLLLLHLTLISLQVEDSQGILLFRRSILAVSTPIFSFVSGAGRAASGLWLDYVWLRGARRENERLQDSLRQAAMREQALEQARRENERLRRLLGYRQLLDTPSVAARVVGRAPDYLSNVAYIDRGSKDGVQPDSPVVTEAGIVGRTTLVFIDTAQVQLITNPDASIGVSVERTQSLGVIKGNGNPTLALDYIGVTEQIQPGDTLLTSGLDGIYPSGLPVGWVISSRKGKKVFREIEVRPYTDPVRVRDVLVLPPVQRAR